MIHKNANMYQVDWDKIIGGICGFFGGMISFVNFSWIDPTYWVSLAKAGLTALICGCMGVAGKYLFLYLQKQFKKFKNKDNGIRKKTDE